MCIYTESNCDIIHSFDSSPDAPTINHRILASTAAFLTKRLRSSIIIPNLSNTVCLYGLIRIVG